MRIDWAQELRDIDGGVIPQTELTGDGIIVKMDSTGKPVPLTLGRACINAVLAEFRDDNETGEQKLNRFRLAMQIAYVLGCATHQAAAWLLVYCWQFI